MNTLLHSPGALNHSLKKEPESVDYSSRMTFIPIPDVNVLPFEEGWALWDKFVLICDIFMRRT